MREMQSQLDPGGKTMAAQDFCHTVQESHESVADFIRRLEKVFWQAYGKEAMSAKTRSTLLMDSYSRGYNTPLYEHLQYLVL